MAVCLFVSFLLAHLAWVWYQGAATGNLAEDELSAP